MEKETKNTNVSETFSRESARKLFGANYEFTSAYSLDHGTFWTAQPEQKTHSQMDISMLRMLAQSMRQRLESTTWMRQYELAGFATMRVRLGVRRPMFTFTDSAKFNKNGNSYVGTIILRDRQTGKLSPLPRNWVYAGEYRNRDIDALSMFASDTDWHDTLLVSLLRSYDLIGQNGRRR